MLVVMILGMSNPSIQIIDRRVGRKGMAADLLPAGVTEPRSPQVLIVVGSRGVAGLVFTSQGLDMSFSGRTRHDEEGEGDKDESKEVSSKGNFERRHGETPSIISLVLSNHVAPL